MNGERERLFAETGMFRVEDDQRALIDFRQSACLQRAVHGFNFVAIERFPENVIERDAHALIDCFKACVGNFVNPFPQRKIFRIALLQFDQFLPCRFQCLRIVFGALRTRLIQGFQRFDGNFGCFVKVVSCALDFRQQNAELRAPVADVIVADNLCAAEAQKPLQRFADDHRA